MSTVCDIDDTVINDMDMFGDYDDGIDNDYNGNAGYKVFACHNDCFWEFLSKKYLGQISIFCTKVYQIWKKNCTFVQL